MDEGGFLKRIKYFKMMIYKNYVIIFNFHLSTLEIRIIYKYYYRVEEWELFNTEKGLKTNYNTKIMQHFMFE